LQPAVASFAAAELATACIRCSCNIRDSLPTYSNCSCTIQLLVQLLQADAQQITTVVRHLLQTAVWQVWKACLAWLSVHVKTGLFVVYDLVHNSSSVRKNCCQVLLVPWPGLGFRF
jgi:hypothetical protein